MVNRPDRVLVWASQLRANDFPPVCAMTGRPAETWRKFRFATAPGWAYLFLLLLCVGIGLLLIFIVMAAVSRRASGYLPLTRDSRRGLALASWLPIGLILVGIICWIGSAVASGFGPPSTQNVSAAHYTLVYTTWAPDAKVTIGPEPGYRPELTGLTGADLVAVTAQKDSIGEWAIDLRFDATGTALLARLTQANVAACPGDPNTVSAANCPQRHLAMWVGLTQADVDRWEDITFVSAVSKPWSTTPSTTDPQPKFLTDPITLEEIDGGQVQLFGGFTETDAKSLAADLQPQPTPGPTSATERLASALTPALLLIGILFILGGLVGVVIARQVYGPAGKVMERRPNEWDQLVEIRRVHPAFVAAVQAHQQARATQAVPPPPPAPLLPGSK